MKFTAPRGTKDILPEETARWQWLEAKFREQCRLYGFGEIRIPIFEETELYARSTGEETEIVTKQMYTFTDRGDRSLTLRPEGTPGVVRAYVQSGMVDQGGVQRLSYFGPFFRYERPQAGRFRQFHQAGVEVFGAPGPDVDAEMIALFIGLIRSLGISGYKLRLNSMGCTECRTRYRDALREALAPVVDQLCDWCQERYKGNTLRILDEKRPSCRALFGELPSILDYLDDACREHFEGVRVQLDELGITYEIDPTVVRGLDYYTRTVFEVNLPGIGAQDALGGGGRYDGMVELFGGKSTPAIGWAAGIERLLDAAEKAGATEHQKITPVYIAVAGDEAKGIVPGLLASLREAEVAAISDLQSRSLKAQMKDAARVGSRWVVMIGEDELAAGTVTLRDMRNGEQQTLKREALVETLTGLME